MSLFGEVAYKNFSEIFEFFCRLATVTRSFQVFLYCFFFENIAFHRFEIVYQLKTLLCGEHAFVVDF